MELFSIKFQGRQVRPTSLLFFFRQVLALEMTKRLHRSQTDSNVPTIHPHGSNECGRKMEWLSSTKRRRNTMSTSAQKFRQRSRACTSRLHVRYGTEEADLICPLGTITTIGGVNEPKVTIPVDIDAQPLDHIKTHGENAKIIH